MKKYAWLIVLVGISVILAYAGIDNPSPNADTIDGLNSTQFLRSDEDDYTTEQLGVETAANPASLISFEVGGTMLITNKTRLTNIQGLLLDYDPALDIGYITVHDGSGFDTLVYGALTHQWASGSSILTLLEDTLTFTTINLRLNDNWISGDGDEEGIRVSTTGTVGIGTSVPKSTLDVSGSISAGTYAGVTAAPANGFIISGDVGIGTTTPDGVLDVTGVAAARTYFQFGTNTLELYFNTTSNRWAFDDVYGGVTNATVFITPAR